MRIPLARYGLKELIIMPLILAAIAGLSHTFWPTATPWPQLTAALLWIYGLCFFRDFDRPIPTDPNLLLAPADGKITDIVEVDEPDFIKGAAIRIGIFLSVFDVHVNRSPCQATVRSIQPRDGLCINAMKSDEASTRNRAVSLGLDCPANPAEKIMVRQITGLIARRIVCDCRIDDPLAPGQRYGMIKFGSRTELYIPLKTNPQITIKKGDTARAGVHGPTTPNSLHLKELRRFSVKTNRQIRHTFHLQIPICCPR